MHWLCHDKASCATLAVQGQQGLNLCSCLAAPLTQARPERGEPPHPQEPQCRRPPSRLPAAVGWQQRASKSAG
eukprot:11169723-Lingulodinium_polyedra.AAC.1